MLEDLRKKEKISLDYLQGKRVAALAGIAKPESFSSLLTQLGAEVVKTMFFPDHHRYQPKDLNKWKGDLPIITTKKDAVKLKNLSLPNQEILVLDVELKIEKEKEFQRILKNYLLSLN
jgi:tetraacyldisaccharide 4'-kinase